MMANLKGSKYPPAEPEALQSLPHQRGISREKSRGPQLLRSFDTELVSRKIHPRIFQTLAVSPAEPVFSYYNNKAVKHLYNANERLSIYNSNAHI